MTQKLWLPKSVIEALQKPVEKQEDRPNCPECNSNLHVVFEGFSNSKHKCICRFCKKSFLFPYVIANESKLIKLNKPKTTVDSILGIPCFLCSESNRGCIPENCLKLDQWVREEKFAV
jgi:hypothetical protein